MEFRYILNAIIVGIGATLLTDLWNLFLKYSFKIKSLNFCLLGRWLLYMPDGIFIHSSILAKPPKAFECVIGWMAHYSIGITLTLLFIVFSSVNWLVQPTLLPALLYGVCTVVFPFFVMQPSLGLGIASSNTPNPTRARLKSIMTHIVFGVGIWLTALVIS